MNKPKYAMVVALSLCFLLVGQGCRTMGNDALREEPEESPQSKIIPGETTPEAEPEKSSEEPAAEATALPEEPPLEDKAKPPAPPDGDQVASTTSEAEEFFGTGLKFYYGDEDLIPDRSIAFRCFLLAAKRGHKDAAYRVGICMLAGRGTRKDSASAEKWLRIASSRGSFLAQELLEDL